MLLLGRLDGQQLENAIAESGPQISETLISQVVFVNYHIMLSGFLIILLIVWEINVVKTSCFVLQFLLKLHLMSVNLV